jgi:acyl carrier protein
MTALPGTGVSAPAVRQAIEAIVRTVLERDDIDPTADLFDQGATSLAFTRILAQVNEKYDIAVDVATLTEASVEQLSALVVAQTSGS